MRTLTKKDLVVPQRKRRSHKGQNGVILVIGGSEDFVGAVALAGVATLRSGCDLAIIAAPEKVAWAVNCISPDLITHKLPGKLLAPRHYTAIKKLAVKADVVLIGNGIGRAAETRRLVKKLLKLPNKKVIDADALRMVNAHELHNTIITPHQNELEEFLANSQIQLTRNLEKPLKNFFGNGNVLLLKGETDLVLGKKGSVVNKTGNAGMTRGGTGDVLAGLCAGYYAQLNDPWKAACNAAYINGIIGDLLLTKKKGYSYLASDMVEELQRISRHQ